MKANLTNNNDEFVLGETKQITNTNTNDRQPLNNNSLIKKDCLW